MKTNTTMTFTDLVCLVAELRRPFLRDGKMNPTTFAAQVRAFHCSVWRLSLPDLRVDEKKTVRDSADDLLDAVQRLQKGNFADLCEEFGFSEEADGSTLIDLWEFVCHFAVDDLEEICVEVGERKCLENEANPVGLTFEDLLA